MDTTVLETPEKLLRNLSAQVRISDLALSQADGIDSVDIMLRKMMDAMSQELCRKAPIEKWQDVKRGETVYRINLALLTPVLVEELKVFLEYITTLKDYGLGESADRAVELLEKLTVE